jgi:hypothetical protein
MARPEYITIRVPEGYLTRIQRLADAVGIPVSRWVEIAIRKHATDDALVAAGPGSETIAISRDATFGWSQSVIRFAIAVALTEAERRAPRPPVIDPVEQEAARGAVIVDAMEVEL